MTEQSSRLSEDVQEAADSVRQGMIYRPVRERSKEEMMETSLN